MSRHGTTAPRVVDGNAQDFTPLGLVIKVRLGDDVRRIPILNEDLTHDELMLMMQRVFRGKLSGSDEVVIKYADEDGDLVTIVDGSDLSFAIQCCRGVLNLTLLVNGKALPPESNEIRHVRQELQSLRKHVDSLLDALSLVSHVPDAPKSLPANAKVIRESAVPSTDDAANVNHAAVSQPTAVLSPTSGREFDPLSAAGQHRSSVDENVQQKVLSSFGLAAASTPADVANMRSGTPDSVGSVGSAHSSRQTYQQPVQTGYNQSQAAQVGYIQQQTGYAAAQSANVPSYSNMAGQQYAGQQGALPREPQQQQQSYIQQQQQQQLSQQQQLQQQQQLSQQQQLQQQQQLPQQQQLQQQQLPQQQYNQQQVSSPGTGRAGPNPYASGLHYGGQYPRPHGQFPQAS